MGEVDVLVIGAGIAGMAAALEAHRAGAEVALVWAGEGASLLAQGGMAAAVGEGDSVAAHAADTSAAGAGISQPWAVDSIVQEGPAAVQWLSQQGVEWDRGANGQLALALEGAHSRPRIVHARGDRSGQVISQALRSSLLLAERGREGGKRIFLRSQSQLEGFLVDKEGVAGAQFRRAEGSFRINARTTVLAVGGYAGLYPRSVTSPNCNGAALALAAAAGAELVDLELVQFHPTVYSGKGAPFLITEALRGAGGWLVDDRGDRFLERYDPRGELAPRAVVTRAIEEQYPLPYPPRKGEGGGVWLDVRHLDPALLTYDFPGFLTKCREVSLDPTRELVPVAPAAHYTMGGILTDLQGRTSAPGLMAAGECARVGIHGANRLASNSLLEAVVMGRRVGSGANSFTRPPIQSNCQLLQPEGRGEMNLAQIRQVISRAAGPTRHIETLLQAQTELNSGRGEEVAVEAVRLLATWTIGAALTRAESRGAHYRRDYPELDPQWGEREIVIRKLSQAVDARQLAIKAGIV